MIYVFVHLTNAIFVILKQIAAASLEMNSIDFPLGPFGFSLSEGYYLIRSEEGSVRYLPCLRLRLASTQSLTLNTDHSTDALTNYLTSIKYDITHKYISTKPVFFFPPVFVG